MARLRRSEQFAAVTESSHLDPRPPEFFDEFHERSRTRDPDAAYEAVRIVTTLWAFAYVEELFWNRGVWHERNWMFGANWDWTAWKVYLVPLLAVPQLTHYVLDGFIWRRNAFRVRDLSR